MPDISLRSQSPNDITLYSASRAFWVKGTGNITDATNHWSDTSGGVPSVTNLPGRDTDLLFDSLSSTGNYTTTVDNNLSGHNLNFSAAPGGTGVVTFAGSGFTLSMSGSPTFLSGMTSSWTGVLNLNGVGITSLITTNGVSLNNSLTLGGAGSTFRTVDDFTTSGNTTMSLGSGTFDANGRTFTILNGNATSTITGNPWTFFNLTRTGSAATAEGLLLGTNITVTGTLNITGNGPSNRILFRSNTIGTARTVTAAAVSLTDVDFQDITGAGAASPFTGTRLGDAKANSGVTFTTAASKFYVGNTNNWNTANVWALTSGGAGATNNYPLVQDTCVFDANSFSGSSQTVTFNFNDIRAGTIDFSAVTATGITANFNSTVGLYGDFKFLSGMSCTTGGTVNFSGRNTQTITSAGVSWSPVMSVNSLGGTVTLADNLTNTLGVLNGTHLLIRGTLNLNGKILSLAKFSDSGIVTKAITAGGGTMAITGNNTTICTIANGTTFNDALQLDCNYSGATGTRTVSLSGASTATGPSVKFSAGTDTVALSGSLVNLDFTGFSGTYANNNGISIFGSLTISATTTWTAGSTASTMTATSGTQTITTNGVTLDSPLTFSGVGGTWQLQDNLTSGTTRDVSLFNGILDLNGKTLSVGHFVSNVSTARTLKSGAAGGILKTLDTTATAVISASITTNLTLDQTGNNWEVQVGGNTTNIRTVNLGSASWPKLTFTNTTAGGELDFGTGFPTTIKSLVVSTPPQTIKFTAGSTVSIQDDNGFPSGTTGNLVTITSITAAQHTLTKAAGPPGVVSSDFLSISQSAATPASPASWFAGHNSANGGSNSGWVFTGGGTANAQTGTLSFIGSTTRTTNKKLQAATLSFSGSISRTTNKVLSGTLSFIGSLTKFTSKLLPPATLNFVGNLAKMFIHPFTATLSFAGSFSKTTLHNMTGTLSFSGAITRSVSKVLTGTLSFVGAMTKFITRSLTGTLSFVGNLTVSRLFIRALTATLSFSGAISRQTNKSLTGTLSFVGSITKRINKGMTATLSFVGSLAKRVTHSFTATLSFVGAMAKTTNKVLTANLPFIGSISRSLGKSLSGTLSFIGAIKRSTSHNLSAANLSFVGNLTKSTSKSLAGTLSFVGNITKQISHKLTATLSFSGNLNVSKLIRIFFTATLNFSGNLTKSTRKSFAGVLSFIGNLTFTHIVTSYILTTRIAVYAKTKLNSLIYKADTTTTTVLKPDNIKKKV